MAKDKEPTETYDCVKCPSFCCTAYAYVQVTHNDMKLMASHLGITLKQFRKKYTDFSELDESPNERQLKKVPDALLNTTCIFLDQQTRLCGIHEARPDVCRNWTGVVEGDKKVCHYFNLYKFLEDEQGKHYLPLVQIEQRVWKKKDRPRL